MIHTHVAERGRQGFLLVSIMMHLEDGVTEGIGAQKTCSADCNLPFTFLLGLRDFKWSPAAARVRSNRSMLSRMWVGGLGGLAGGDEGAALYCNNLDHWCDSLADVGRGTWVYVDVTGNTAMTSATMHFLSDVSFAVLSTTFPLVAAPQCLPVIVSRACVAQGDRWNSLTGEVCVVQTSNSEHQLL